MSTITRAELATAASDLVCDQADAVMLLAEVDNLIDDELPNIPNGWTAQQYLLDLVAGTATLSSLDGTLVKLLAVFWGGRELSHEPQSALDASGAAWQDRVGPPRFWTTDREEDRTLRVVPVPSTSTVGTSDTVVTERDRLLLLALGSTTTIPKYLRLPGALWILSREYARESKYRDTNFAKLCQTIAERMFNLLDGIVVDPATQGKG